MRLFFATFLLLFFTLLSNAQEAEIIVFSKEKKVFTLFIDGLKENDTPKWKVKVKNLTSGPHHLRVLFKNGQNNTLQKRINLAPSSTLTYELLLYENRGRSWYDFSKIDSILKNKKKDNINITQDTAGIKKAEAKVDSLLKVHTPTTKVISIKKDSIKKTIPDTLFQCSNPTLPTLFSVIVSELATEEYEDEKLDKAKELATKNCFSSIQIMEIMQLMEFEVSKIEFAIFCYKKCFDPMHYNFVEDAFEYPASVTKMKDAIYTKSKKNTETN